MTPTFPYAGHEHSAVWWALCLLVVAVATFGLMVLFLARATRAYTQVPARETTTELVPVAPVVPAAEQPAPSLAPTGR